MLIFTEALKPGPKLARSLILMVWLSVSPAVRADWKDDVGYTRLTQTFTTGVPTAVTNGVSHIEAGDASGHAYQPDFSTSEFSGKLLTAKSAGTGSADHSTTVGAYFFGNTTSLIPDTVLVDSYNATGWLNTDFLNYGQSSLPKTETRRVQNHSWSGAVNNRLNTSTQIKNRVTNINQRLDYSSNRDGFLAVTGVNNGASTLLPDLICQTYHGVAVGLTSGAHRAGLTTHDGVGRMKPDLVASGSMTSIASAQVSSAAGLITEKLHLTPYSPALATADYPRLTKALLLAGATKETIPAWSRAGTEQPYDSVYGAGALNILLAYDILVAGPKTASSSATLAETGWAVASVSRCTFKGKRTYFFDVPVGTTQSRFSCALTWHRTVTPAQILKPGSSPKLANLDLRLFAVAVGTFKLGTQLDASLSKVDNVEHLYQATLAPGRYALQVSSASISTTSYALAWRCSPTVTVAATTPISREQASAPRVFTLTRTGATTAPLLIPLVWSGTAVAGIHYTLPPASLLIPAGSSTATVEVSPTADALSQGDRTITLTVATDFSLSSGPPEHATLTLEPKP